MHPLHWLRRKGGPKETVHRLLNQARGNLPVGVNQPYRLLSKGRGLKPSLRRPARPFGLLSPYADAK
eukprot:2301511-Alexandrium_andersonii.AAC.1